MTDEKQPPKHTEYLKTPEDTHPMRDRAPSPGTVQLSSAWRLTFKIGKQIHHLEVQDEMTIGRAQEDNPESVEFDLTPYGAFHFGVSRVHARLTLHDGFLYIEDLGSTNGTRINGFQLTPNQKYRLRDGDEIEFARLRTNMRFEKAGN